MIYIEQIVQNEYVEPNTRERYIIFRIKDKLRLWPRNFFEQENRLLYVYIYIQLVIREKIWKNRRETCKPFKKFYRKNLWMDERDKNRVKANYIISWFKSIRQYRLCRC